MMDTKCLEDEKNPRPLSDDNIKCFQFEVELSSQATGIIYAHDEEEARELIMKGKNDDIREVIKEKVENIVSVVEILPDI